MNNLRAILIAGLLCMGSVQAAEVFKHPLTADRVASELLPQAAQAMRAAQVVRGQFVYRKFLTEVPAPLESSGEYLFVKSEGLVWHTQQPFESEFVITPQGMRQREAGAGE